MYGFLSATEQGYSTKKILSMFNLSIEQYDNIVNNLQMRWYNLLTTEKSSSGIDYSIKNNDKKYGVPVYYSPLTAEIHLTERCNLECRHCLYSCTKNTSYGELNSAQWINFLKSLQQQKFFNAVLTGGEIFCYSDIDSLLEGIKDLRIHFDILTNAMLINEHHAKILNSPNISLAISMDGSTPEIHDYLRGKGSFKILMNKIDLLSKEKVKKYLSVTVHAKNYQDLLNIIKYADENDCKGVSFTFLVEHGRAKYNSELHLPRKLCKSCVDSINEVKKDYRNLNISFLDPLSGISNGKVRRNGLISCTGGTSHISITSDGYVYPCVYAFGYDNLNAGNIIYDSIESIWKSPKFNLMRGGVHISEVEKCKDCSLVEYCSLVNCRVRALKYGGDFYGSLDCDTDTYIIQNKAFGIDE